MEIIALIMVLVLALIGTLGSFDIVEYFRRRKHPKWYEYFDRAKHNSFSVGGRLGDEIDIANKCIATMQEAYRKGTITEKVFRRAMEIYTDDYIKAVAQYNKDYLESGIDEDLKAADAYARKHNCKWGIIYENKET